MSLKKLYGDTGLLSAKATGLIYFTVEIVASVVIWVISILINLHIIKPEPMPEDFDWDDFMESLGEEEKRIIKKDIAKRRKKHGQERTFSKTVGVSSKRCGRRSRKCKKNGRSSGQEV